MGIIIIKIFHEPIIYRNVENYSIDYDYSEDSLKLEVTTNRHHRIILLRKDVIQCILYKENKHAKELSQ